MVFVEGESHFDELIRKEVRVVFDEHLAHEDELLFSLLYARFGGGILDSARFQVENFYHGSQVFLTFDCGHGKSRSKDTVQTEALLLRG